MLISKIFDCKAESLLAGSTGHRPVSRICSKFKPCKGSSILFLLTPLQGLGSYRPITQGDALCCWLTGLQPVSEFFSKYWRCPVLFAVTPSGFFSNDFQPLIRINRKK
jgi:hypothetical protein